MRTLLIPILALSLAALVGCGPMKSGPMPARLEPDEQKKIDEAWENALTPIDKLDRQATLDTLVLSEAYQGGVDKLQFRSEKKFSGGVVVMEIHFDRAEPNDDRFEVTIRAPGGQELRHLVYNRAEVETTLRELHDRQLTAPADPNAPPLDPVTAKKREEVQKRLAAVEKLFPKPEEPKAKE